MYTKLWGKYCFLNFLVISYIQSTFGCCVAVEPKLITSIFSHIRGRTGRTQKRVNFEVHEDLLYYLRFLPAIPSASIFPPSSPPQSHPSHSVTPPVHPVTPLVHPVNPCITLKHPLLHPVTILLTLFTLVHSVTPSYPLLQTATPCYTHSTLDRVTKSFFWNFQKSRAVLCYILKDKEMLHLVFRSNIAPSLSSGNHLFYKAECMGRSCPNQVWTITFDWSALATWNKHFQTAFW